MLQNRNVTNQLNVNRNDIDEKLIMIRMQFFGWVTYELLI